VKLTHQDVLRAIESWQLQSVVTCREVKGKTELTYAGTTSIYPHWLAVQKANQIGADHQCDTP
jgi:hypothetical protein